MTSKRFITSFVVFILAIALVACGSSDSKKAKFYEKGMELYAKGEYGKAAINFGNAAKIDPQFADAYAMMGQSLMKRMQFKQAFGALTKAVELKADLWDAHVALGNIYLAGRKKDMAWEKVNLVLSKNPNHHEALLLKANCLTSEGRYAEAHQIITSLIDKDPDNNNLYLILATILLREKNLIGAEKALTTLLLKDETNIRGHLLLAQILEHENRLPEAENELKILVSQQPDKDEPKILLAQFYNRTNKKSDAEKILTDMINAKPREMRLHLNLARFYFDNKQYEQMVATLQTVIKDFPGQYAPYDILARYELGQNNKDKAIELLEQYMASAKSGPDILKAKTMLAGIRFYERNFDESMKLVNEVLAENPNDATGHTLKGDLLVAQKDYVGAIAEYRTVIKDEPENTSVLLGLARTHLLNKEPEIAKDTYRSILTINPNTGPALLALGNMALDEKDLDTADRYFSRLLTVAPESPVPYYKKGIVKQLEQKGEEATVLFEKALEANIDYTPALVRSLDPLLQEKNVDEAIQRVERQLKKSPENPSYYIVLGKLYAVKKDYATAEKNFEKAYEINPNSQQALFNLARLEHLKGSPDEALANYEKMRKLNPDDTRIPLLMAMTMEQKGEPKEAAAIYEEILGKTPDSPLAANNLAFYYAEYEPTKENLEKAEKIMAPLLEKFKNEPAIVDTGAWVFYRKGDYKKAADLMTNIQDKIKKVPAINYHVGMIHLGLGDKPTAQEHLKRAVESGEKFPGYEDAQKALSRVSGK
ncbi:MAG: tetratricopeptide repeat protein [Deltaproteobacteria bacterium]|nr:tetratricopeptide repeat protein [Deltaproteobacteria bacterium]